MPLQVKINKDSAKANMTSLVGYVNTTFDFLRQKLGEPLETSCDKINTQWIIEFPDNTICTIYDWKLSKTPYHPYNWHIGGHKASAIVKLQDLLGIPTQGH
jgi:hypothetical protein